MQAKRTAESIASGTLDAFLKADGSMIAIVQTKPAGDVTIQSIDEVEALTRQSNPDGNFQRAVVNGLEVRLFTTTCGQRMSENP